MHERQYVIACPHKGTRDVFHIKVLSDYHKISISKIESLLRQARQNAKKADLIDKITTRLRQGIPGMTCPPPKKGPVFKKYSDLMDLFVRQVTVLEGQFYFEALEWEKIMS